jgi:N-acetylneuraminic acid mutarotase
MRTIAVTLCILIGTLLSAQNTWEKKAAFGNDKRSRCVSFSIGNRGYVGCGEDTADLVRNDFWEYDPGTDTWTQKATLPGAGRRDAVGFAIGTKGYVGTGIDAAESQLGNNLNDWWEYNPATNTWLSRAPYPGSSSWGGIYFGCGFVCNGMGYIVGGKQGNSNYTSSLYRYNPTTNSWTQMAQFPGGTRYAMSAFTINNKAYVGLGTDENILQTDWWEYNASNNTWLQKGSFPGSGRFAAAGFAIGQKGYLLGGTDGGYKDELWQYDVPTDSWWVKAPYDGGPRRSMAVFVIANAAYAGTGSGFTGKRRDFWQYEQFLTGVDEIAEQSPGIYPNPVDDHFVLAVPAAMQAFPDNTWMSILSSDGKLVMQLNVSAQSQVNVNAATLSAGIYTVQISSDQWHAQTSLLKK